MERKRKKRKRNRDRETERRDEEEKEDEEERKKEEEREKREICITSQFLSWEELLVFHNGANFGFLCLWTDNLETRMPPYWLSLNLF